MRSSPTLSPTPSPTPQTSQRPLFSTVRSSPTSSTPPSVSLPSSSTNPFLSEVKAQYEAEQAAAEHQRQRELEAEQRRQRQREEQARREQLEAEERQRHAEEKRQAARLHRAQDWLKQLDPTSDEGFWFESFAISYPSKLDAALEYLDALDTTE
ncbi:MAG: hypothetical protein F6K30_09555 [Cyanothece sp. SIO2G6]|nr:hypothetical protein [Cyanothece sp. SIO2G6]